jgi:hypothetical protein
LGSIPSTTKKEKKGKASKAWEYSLSKNNLKGN